MTGKSCATSALGDRVSASTALTVTQKLVMMLFAAICLGAVYLPAVSSGIRIVLGVGFLAATAFRIWCASVVLLKGGPETPPGFESDDRADDAWPTYTIVLALYREAHMVPALLTAIHAIDYPRSRMEILVAAESDDDQTWTACRAFQGCIPMSVVYGSGDAPRTKPRALNAALKAAVGEFLVVYDAEDQPHPQQLKESAMRFMTAGKSLGVLQAPLRVAVDHKSSFLQQQFSIDYAALFEVILPALAHIGCPFPLGGSSNHFRREALDCVGGWDPWNVTEDADIGFRLARLGYRSELRTSPTFETAPSTLRPWIKQRSRWIKGHLQTLKVHTHRLSDLTPAAGLSLFMTLGLNVASAAATGPILCMLTALACADGIQHHAFHLDPFDVTVLLAGWFGATVSMGVGMHRAGGKLSVLPFLLAPMFWAAQSIAFARAVHQFVFRPYHWDKTEHVPVDGAPTGAGLDGSMAFGLSGGSDPVPSAHLGESQPAFNQAMG